MKAAVEKVSKNTMPGLDKDRGYPQVSVIVLNYNGKRFLDDCFRSLEKVDYPNFEVVMVDNKSTDDSVEYVKRNYKWVRVIQAPSDDGFASGNNIGIRNTAGDYVLLLSNDTISTPDFLSRLVEVAESDKTIGIVGAWPLHYEYKKYKDNVLKHQTLQVSTICGAVMLIRRDVLNRIGLLDENHFLYWEDTEYCWRANLYGYKVVQVYNSFIYHIVNASGFATESRKRWTYEFIKNKIYIHIKLMNVGYLGFFLVYEILRSLGRIVIHPYLTRSVINGWKWNLNNLGKIWNERKRIRLNKRISDWSLVKRIFNDELVNRRDWKRLHNLAEHDRKITNP